MSVNKTTTFKFGGKDYKVNFPNNRQYIAIHNLKAQIAPQCAELRFMGAESNFAELLVDTIAHLRIMCPDLNGEINKDPLDLELVEGRTLTQAYTDQINKWYQDNLKFIFDVNKDKDADSIPTE